ncbi:14931_t:CDS:2, partial [Racocetra fulgida]
YDALPDIGHACGHNLIAISGVGAAIGLKAVLEKFNIKGTVKLFGIPAEEKGSGKTDLIKAGAYEGVDISLMVHPSLATVPSRFTDQGNVTYLVSGFHPLYDICTPVPTNAKQKTAYEETIKATSGMTLVGLDFLIDDEFAKQVNESFTKSKL